MSETNALRDLGWEFDNNDVLKNIETQKTFEFTTQEDYEELGEAITEEIYKLLVERFGLVKTLVKPEDSTDKESDLSFIFVSEGFDEKETILVLFHGTGVVRAGQWARRLIINESLETGTQFAYIKKALDNGWGVVVMNTNHIRNGKKELKYSCDNITHALNAWKFFISNSKCQKIHIVAHSRGGYDVSKVLEKYGGDERTSLVCLTDSSFSFPRVRSRSDNPLMAVNFAASEDFDRITIPSYLKNRVTDVYAGTNIHERSSHCAVRSIFHILENNMTAENYIEVMTAAMKLLNRDDEAGKDDKTEEEEKEEEKEEPEVKKQRLNTDE